MNWQAALIPGAISLVTLIFILSKLMMGASSGDVVTPNKRFGKGPYTRYSCASSAQFAKQIADMLRKLQEGALREDWKIDWPQLKGLISTAETATKNKDHSGSIRAYGRALSFLMDQLRNQGDANSSSIDL